LRRATATAERKAIRKGDSTVSQAPSLAPIPNDELPAIKISVRDVNPFSAVGAVMRVPMNAVTIIFSGCLYAFQYSLSYTGAQSFAGAPYNYSAIKVGLVLLCLGVGSIVGSILGGRCVAPNAPHRLTSSTDTATMFSTSSSGAMVAFLNPRYAPDSFWTP
jgi:predicted MFS family arabinose efflux permease